VLRAFQNVEDGLIDYTTEAQRDIRTFIPLMNKHNTMSRGLQLLPRRSAIALLRLKRSRMLTYYFVARQSRLLQLP
jgi:hypothetical protein